VLAGENGPCTHFHWPCTEGNRPFVRTCRTRHQLHPCADLYGMQCCWFALIMSKDGRCQTCSLPQHCNGTRPFKATMGISDSHLQVLHCDLPMRRHRICCCVQVLLAPAPPPPPALPVFPSPDPASAWSVREPPVAAGHGLWLMQLVECLVMVRSAPGQLVPLMG